MISGIAVSLRARAVLLMVVIALLGLTACSSPENQVHKYEYFAFGTLISLTIAGVNAEQAKQASTSLEAEFNRMHHAWHAWQPGPLSDINHALAVGESVELNAEFSDLITRAMTIAEQSEQTFHPGMGKLLELWGFQSDDIPTTPPSQASIDTFLEHAPALSDLTILDDGKTHLADQGVIIQSNNPLFQFDLGGFAKGYGIDRAIQILQSQGIQNAIVNAGGDLRAIGQRPDRPWRIGIRHPRRAGIMAYLDVLDGESVFTSGDYERYFFYEDKRYHHILDPRSGSPADQAISVTVLHEEAALADAAATALFVAGPDQWREVAAKMGVTNVMLVDQNGLIQMTDAMRERLVLTVEQIDANDEVHVAAESGLGSEKEEHTHVDR